VKRFAFLTGVFFVAALIGMGVAGLATDARADICDDQDIQYQFECDSPLCAAHPFYKHAKFTCGTRWPSGGPCECEFTACVLLCETVFPLP